MENFEHPERDGLEQFTENRDEPLDDVGTMLQELQNAGKAKIRARGESMRGRINNGQLVTLEVVLPEEVLTGDIVLARWKKDKYLLHLVSKIEGEKVQLCNNLGKINGWVANKDIIAKATHIED